METTVIILWVYIALLIAGGLMGFIKAKSKASIIVSPQLVTGRPVPYTAPSYRGLPTCR